MTLVYFIHVDGIEIYNLENTCAVKKNHNLHNKQLVRCRIYILVKGRVD